MKKIAILILVLFAFLSNAQEKKLCITVNDLPAVTGGVSDYEFRLQITNDLISTFKEYNTSAIGYVNERKVYRSGIPDASEVKLLELWMQNGLELGNHTFSHPNYHKVPFDQYTENILKGEKII